MANEALVEKGKRMVKVEVSFESLESHSICELGLQPRLLIRVLMYSGLYVERTTTIVSANIKCGK